MADLEKKIYVNQQIKEKEYWLNKFTDINAIGSFPFDVEQQESNTLIEERYSTYNFELDIELSNEIKKLSKGNDERFHVILTASVLLFLNHYIGDNNSFVGIPIKKESLKNNTINTALPISVLYVKDISIRAYLSIVRNAIIEATNNQNYPIDLLAEQLGVYNNRNEPSLFDVVVMLNGLHKLESISNFNCSTFFCFNNEESNIGCDIKYNTSVYSIGTIERISKNFKYFLEQLYCYDLDRSLTDIEYICKEEKQQLLYEFNDTDVDFPLVKVIPQLFEEQAIETPDSIAVALDGKYITYKELHHKSSNLASVLLKEGIKSNDIVVLLFDTSIEMIISMIGVLRAGASFLPFDISNPIDRINYILQDSKSKFLITKEFNTENLSISSDKIIDINLVCSTNICSDHYYRMLNDSFNSIAYVMYTSGTTGVPKGIAITHKSFVEFNLWAVKEFNHGLDYQVLLSNSYASDGAIQQMFPPLITGGCLHLVKKETRLDIQKYIGYLRKNRINNIDEVPVIMKEIFNTVVLDPNKELLPDLTCISLGSEYVPIDIVKKSRKYLNWHGKIINAYGPAEASVEATTYHFHGDLENEISLIGKPRSNTKIYIIDKHDNLSPIGVKGEICICSIGLARGYLNRVELTNSRFTINKFSSAFDGFLYKTGDQGRWLPDGNIEFLGRIDDQVKVRGFRIELGEIESILSKHEKVSENVVLAREDHGDKYLCAYVVFDQEQDIEDLRTYLAGILPDYMVPSYFIRLEEMPLTSNGKVNRKALPSPEIKASEDYTAASNDMEEKLVEIWSEVLNIPSGEISVTANFFALGGHSLKAMVLISKINKEFNIMISLVKIFEEPIIISMAMTIFNLAEQDKIIEEIEI